MAGTATFRSNRARNIGDYTLEIKRPDGIPRTTWFTDPVRAVAFVLGARGKLRLEKGVFTRRLSDNYCVAYVLRYQGRPFTTDAILPFLARAQERQKKAQQKTAERLAKLDADLARIG